MRIALMSLLCAAVAGCGPTVKQEEMSAEAHRREATREYRRAAEEQRQYDPLAVAEANRATRPQEPLSPYNPTEYHRDAARAIAAHAREHQEAAAALEASEETACRDVPPEERASCPLLGPARLVDLPDGVRLVLPPDQIPDALARMQCELAFARTRGFAPDASCPLSLPGVELRPASDGIDVIAADPGTIEEVRRRARLSVVPASP